MYSVQRRVIDAVQHGGEPVRVLGVVGKVLVEQAFLVRIETPGGSSGAPFRWLRSHGIRSAQVSGIHRVRVRRVARTGLCGAYQSD